TWDVTIFTREIQLFIRVLFLHFARWTPIFSDIYSQYPTRHESKIAVLDFILLDYDGYADACAAALSSLL
ncbi:MAG TPA: hypothetical protein PKI67_16485, partial [bacterium]|nr:hypothetical protein [bacterium]